MNIYEKLTSIQKTLKASKKETNSFGGYKYRTIESIFEGVKPLLAQHDVTLTLSDDLVQVGDRYYIKATAKIFDGEGVIESHAFAREPLTKKGTDESQITGAATTYARKYALTGLIAPQKAFSLSKLRQIMQAPKDAITVLRQKFPDGMPDVRSLSDEQKAWLHMKISRDFVPRTA